MSSATLTWLKSVLFCAAAKDNLLPTPPTPASRKPGRIFEWFVHFNSIGWGIVLSLPVDLPTGGMLQSLFDSGWSRGMLAACQLISGIVGAMALWANGHKPYGSPRFRAAAAAGAVFIYGQFTATLGETAVRTQTISPGFATYGLVTAFCLYACYQSSREAQRA